MIYKQAKNILVLTFQVEANTKGPPVVPPPPDVVIERNRRLKIKLVVATDRTIPPRLDRELQEAPPIGLAERLLARALPIPPIPDRLICLVRWLVIWGIPAIPVEEEMKSMAIATKARLLQGQYLNAMIKVVGRRQEGEEAEAPNIGTKRAAIITKV